MDRRRSNFTDLIPDSHFPPSAVYSDTIQRWIKFVFCPVIGKEVSEYSETRWGSCKKLAELAIGSNEISTAVSCECHADSSTSGESFEGCYKFVRRVVCHSLEMEEPA